MHTFASATDLSLFPEALLLCRRSLNLISRAKKWVGRLIPTWTVFDVRISQDAGLGDAGSKQRWTSCRCGGNRQGGLFLFYFILYDIFIVKVQEIAWSASYSENKTQKPIQINKENIRNNPLQLGSIPVPGPHTGTKLKHVL